MNSDNMPDSVEPRCPKPVSQFPPRLLNIARRLGILSSFRFARHRYGKQLLPHTKEILQMLRQQPGWRFSTSGCAIFSTANEFHKLPLTKTAENLLELELENSKKAEISYQEFEFISITLPYWKTTKYGKALARPYQKGNVPSVERSFDLLEKIQTKFPHGTLEESSHAVPTLKGLEILEILTGQKWSKLQTEFQAAMGPIGATHGDFTQRNLINNESKFSLIDLDRFTSTGFSFFDFIHLFIDTVEKAENLNWTRIINRIISSDTGGIKFSIHKINQQIPVSLAPCIIKFYAAYRIAMEWEAMETIPKIWLANTRKNLGPILYK